MPDQSTYECLIIGGGPAGLTCAIFLGRYRRRVMLIDDARPRNYRDWTEEQVSKLLMHGIGTKDEAIIAIEGRRQQVKALVLATGERSPVESVFFTIGVKRSCGLAEALGCKVFDDTPNIVVDEYKQTSVEGVYAIGDLAPGSQLAITSAADGAIAAIAINKSLLPPSRIV